MEGELGGEEDGEGQVELVEGGGGRAAAVAAVAAAVGLGLEDGAGEVLPGRRALIGRGFLQTRLISGANDRGAERSLASADGAAPRSYDASTGGEEVHRRDDQCDDGLEELGVVEAAQLALDLFEDGARIGAAPGLERQDGPRLEDVGKRFLGLCAQIIRPA